MADPTKPGHCKMLIFYFVNPSTTISSTEYVPPQQQDWWTEKSMYINNGWLSLLPDLIKDNISKYVGFSISLKDTKNIRLELLNECTYDDSDEFVMVNQIKGILYMV